MGIEAEVLEKWLKYAATTIDEIAANMVRQRTERAREFVEEVSIKMEIEKAEKEYQSIVAVSNTLHVLANMYNMHQEFLGGKKPRLRRKELKIFGMALNSYKEIEPPTWIQIKHPEIVHALEDAYIGLGKYAAFRKK